MLCSTSDALQHDAMLGSMMNASQHHCMLHNVLALAVNYRHLDVTTMHTPVNKKLFEAVVKKITQTKNQGPGTIFGLLMFSKE